ncbi:RNA polymerase sigma factor (modular protein) [Streptomyces sp. KY70]|nr:RNA polymerase sigma factor (modular protein) [Streptomyces sp. KY70]
MVNSVNGVDVTALVVAARDGDQAAGERLAALYLPLVYNVVGRALNGHPDVDDVVQETMLRALSGLSSLRDPTRFRSWLVAIAMNQVRTRWSVLGHRPAALEETDEPADPAADFVDLTILRLELSGQRRETAEATRWLDEAERDVLSLWWLETTGELTRAELADALGLPPQHAAVRVQRVKNQLDIGRAVVRALAAEPRCPALDDLVADWDEVPTPLWRKRIARHIRGCASCAATSSGLVPPEGLLSGLALVVPLYEGGQHAAAAVAPAVAPAAFSAGKAAGLAAAAAAVTSIAVLLWPSAPAPPAPRAEGVRRSSRRPRRPRSPCLSHPVRVPDARLHAVAHAEPVRPQRLAVRHRGPAAVTAPGAPGAAPSRDAPRRRGQHPARPQRLPAADHRPPAHRGRPAPLGGHGGARLFRPHRLHGPGHGGPGDRLGLPVDRRGRDHRHGERRPGRGRRGVAPQLRPRRRHPQLQLHARGRGHRGLAAGALLDAGAGHTAMRGYGCRSGLAMQMLLSYSR